MTTIKLKKKICGTCKKKAYIFSKGDCKQCASIRYAKKSRESKKGPTGKTKNYRIPKVSKSMLKKLSEYRPLRDQYMKEHPNCEFEGCNQLSNDLHHQAGRGKNLCNVETFMAICRDHHTWVHDNHKQAQKLGYLK